MSSSLATDSTHSFTWARIEKSISVAKVTQHIFSAWAVLWALLIPKKPLAPENEKTT